MQVVVLPDTGWREAWRDAARRLAAADVPPAAVAWQTGAGLFPSGPLPPPGTVAVPRAFVDLADTVLCHRDPERFALLYAALWRLRGERGLLENPADPLVARLRGPAIAGLADKLTAAGADAGLAGLVVAAEVADAIDRAEVNIRAAEPMVTSLYLEPDIFHDDYVPAARPERPGAPGH